MCMYSVCICIQIIRKQQEEGGWKVGSRRSHAVSLFSLSLLLSLSASLSLPLPVACLLCSLFLSSRSHPPPTTSPPPETSGWICALSPCAVQGGRLSCGWCLPVRVWVCVSEGPWWGGVSSVLSLDLRQRYHSKYVWIARGLRSSISTCTWAVSRDSTACSSSSVLQKKHSAREWSISIYYGIDTR